MNENFNVYFSLYPLGNFNDSLKGQFSRQIDPFRSKLAVGEHGLIACCVGLRTDGEHGANDVAAAGRGTSRRRSDE